jgi:hypothetical protein
VRSSEIRSQLTAPDDLNRKAPLATRYPEDIEEVTEVRMRGNWDVYRKDVAVTDPAFEFSHKVEQGQGDVKYILTDRLRWLKSQVEPGEVREYAANLKKAYGEVGMTLNLADDQPAAAASSVRPFGATENPRRRLIGYGLLLASWFVIAVLCWRSPEAHRSLNWFLMAQLVWISTTLWILASGFPNSWKTQTLGLIVIYFGSIALQSRAEHAPETHWQHAHVNPQALAAKPAVLRYMIRGLQVLPTTAVLIGIGYYLKALMS